MVEQPTPLRSIKEETSQAIDRVKAEADELVEALDFHEMSQKIQDYGKKSPVALALAALMIGMAAGMLMRKRIES